MRLGRLHPGVDDATLHAGIIAGQGEALELWEDRYRDRMVAAGIEVYDDAVAVFHEGRENPDFFLVQSPKQVVFYVNWALDKLRT